MKYVKFIILTAVLTVGFVWPGCNNPPCNCPDIDGEYFDIQGMTSHNCCQNGVLSWEDYRLFLEFEVDYFGSAEPIEESKFNHFSLMPSAWACSCIYNGFNGSMEKLANITMIAKQDFNGEYLANDTITNLFTIDLRNGEEPVSLLNYLETDTSFIFYEDLVLTLNTGPESEREFQMDVILELENGEVYELETDKVTIK